MKFSDELVKRVSEEMVRDEISKAKKTLLPIIKKQVFQYIMSKEFLKMLAKDAKKEAIEQYIEDYSLFDDLTDTERRKLDNRVVKAIFKI